MRRSTGRTRNIAAEARKPRSAGKNGRMETRRLGRSGLMVSVLTLGTMTFGGKDRYAKMGNLQPDQARRFIDLCLEAGMNAFDTADAYSFGVSEEVLGEALVGRRERVILATKVRGRMSEDPNDVGLTRHHIIRGCEASLKRLGTDYIDLYQLHGVDSLTPIDETLRALDDLITAGKIRSIGVSNFSAWMIAKALGVSEREHFARFTAMQMYYSLLARELEFEFIPLAEDQDLGLLVWSPLAAGFLSGKFRRGEEAPPGTRRAELGTPGTVDEEKAYRTLDVLREIADGHGVSVSQVSLNYLLAKRGVTTLIIGARTEEQLVDNLAAAQWKLAPDEVKRLDDASAPTIPYPYWHQRRFAIDRMPELSGA